jgi:hypothetical protein
VSESQGGFELPDEFTPCVERLKAGYPNEYPVDFQGDEYLAHYAATANIAAIASAIEAELIARFFAPDEPQPDVIVEAIR